MKKSVHLPLWSMMAPVVAWLLYFLSESPVTGAFAIVLAAALFSAVLAAVHHVEVIALRLGEPLGTLLLAIAVTVIEVSLIVPLMIAGGEYTSTLARDTIFATVMIHLTGVIGLCLVVGGYHYHEQIVGRYGVNAALISLTAITVLTLILPNYTTTVPGPYYSTSQLIFVSVVSVVLYGAFVMVQTIRHRNYFISPQVDNDKEAPPPSVKTALLSTVLLFVCLGVIDLLANTLAPSIEKGVVLIGAPKALVGVIVALVVILPEGLAAFQAARKNRLQTSLNLALGSNLASIGLTIPAVAFVSVIKGFPLTLGIDARSTLLLILALFTNMLSFGTGRTTILQGIVMLVIFFVYLFTTLVP